VTRFRKTIIALAAGVLGIGAFGVSTQAQANDHYGGGHYGGYSQPSGGYSQYGQFGRGYSQYGRFGGGYSTGRQAPHYHAPSMHYDRVYHADRLHWTPGRGLHTHGHYDLVPHYTPGNWHW
jgi:hypothetical protein